MSEVSLPALEEDAPVSRLRRLFALCGFTYIAIYALEGLVRYELNLFGADSAIFVRDALLAVPVGLLLVAQAFRVRLHPAFLVFAAIVAVHGGMMYLNLHSSDAVAYGVKILIGILFGFLAGEILMRPGRRMLGLFALLFVVSFAGLVLSKYVLAFPWEGMTTHIGGLTVDISHDWETTGLDKRAAGFTRTSIATAMLVPFLALLLASRTRAWLLRLLILGAGVAGVFFTTQKGALIAIIPISLVLCGPRGWRYRLLSVLCALFVFFDIALPLTTSGMLLSDNGGVFSTATLAMRIMDTWPGAWQWILLHQVFPLGVGLGGIGGAQRFYAYDYTNPADNTFLLMYAWFGVLGVLYLVWPTIVAWRVPRAERGDALAALAVLTFLMGYGIVITVPEDPLSALLLGATTGTLWQCRHRAAGRVGADPFDPSDRAIEPLTMPQLAERVPQLGP